MKKLAGKVALVTGAGRGQGRSHAVHLAKAGADIIALDICNPIEGIDYAMSTEADLAKTADSVREAGTRVVTAKVDTRESKAMVDAVDVAVEKLGGLDILVANAGVVVMNTFQGFTNAQWDAVVGVNLAGTWNSFRASVPHMVRRGGGSIIATASIAGVVGLPFLHPYVASKHGIIGLVRASALELADSKIRVNAVCPTSVAHTGISKLSDTHVATQASAKLQSTFDNALDVEQVEPHDVSNAVLFLASDDARFITGTVLPVDAGAIAL
jgi:SDR family mycofactocin-dependent oxidoreductase